MDASLLANLLPKLRSKREQEFNVFSVMRHGTHEKQLSDVFAWLLDSEGSHKLGDLFLKSFVDEVNVRLGEGPPIEPDDFSVSQEVNTSPPGEPMDIADIVLEGGSTILVVENYYTSDGHGHGYASYAAFRAESGKRGVVVLLCRSADETLLADGWENAAVVTYSRLLERLVASLGAWGSYAVEHRDEHWFIQQMYRYFVKGMPVDADLIDFVTAMCNSGEAERFRGAPEVEAVKLGDELRELAVVQFAEGRELLQRIKAVLRSRVAPALMAQVKRTTGEPVFGSVSARYIGVYQWTINFHPVAVPDAEVNDADGLGVLQIKFGPSAWYANSKDKEWERPAPDADYSRLFLTWKGHIRQSAVSLREVADGLADDDTRLRDEIIAFIGSPPAIDIMA